MKLKYKDIASGFFSVFRLGVRKLPEQKVTNISINFALVQEDINKAFAKLQKYYERDKNILR